MQYCKNLGITILLFCVVCSGLPILQTVDSPTDGANNLEKIIRNLQLFDSYVSTVNGAQPSPELLFAMQAAAGLETIFRATDQERRGNFSSGLKEPGIIAADPVVPSHSYILSVVAVPYRSNLKSIFLQPETPPPDSIV